MFYLHKNSHAASCLPKETLDPHSPWTSLRQAFRVNTKDSQKFTFNVDKENPYSITITPSKQAGLVDIQVVNDATKETIKSFTDVESHWDEEGQLVSSIDGKKTKSNVVLRGDQLTVFDDHGRTEAHLATPAYIVASAKGADSAGSVKTPMPCKISQVLVTPGQTIEKGQTLIVLEAMKMEHVIKAPATGTISEVLYNVGDLVEENQSLVTFADDQ